MPVHPPFCTLFQSGLTNQTPTVQHVLAHRRTTWRLALSLLLDNAVIVVPAMVVSWLFAAAVGAPVHIMIVPAASILPFIMLGWNFVWLEWHAPTFSRFLWGGTVYIIEEAGGNIGLTTKVGSAEHRDTKGVVEAVVPGIFFFAPAELRQFKPEYHYAQIEWTIEAITKAMNRQCSYRLDWD